jgi:hypothetical protein
MDKKRFVINILIYLAILLGVIVLYYPFNNNKDNKPKSAVKFIYAQF